MQKKRYNTTHAKISQSSKKRRWQDCCHLLLVLLLGPGADMLKKPTERFEITSCFPCLWFTYYVVKLFASFSVSCLVLSSSVSSICQIGCATPPLSHSPHRKRETVRRNGTVPHQPASLHAYLVPVLCMHTITYILRGPFAMTKGRAPKIMMRMYYSVSNGA